MTALPAAGAAPTRRRRRGTATALLFLGCVAAVARAEDPLINVYMRGSADRVPAHFPMVLHFVPDIPAWSSGELMSAVLSDAGLQELRKQCGNTVGLTEADHIPHTTTYSGVARMRAGCLKGFLDYNARNQKIDLLPFLDMTTFSAKDSGRNVTFEITTKDRGIDGSWWLIPWTGNGPAVLKRLQQCYPPGFRWCTEPKDVKLAPSGRTAADVPDDAWYGPAPPAAAPMGQAPPGPFGAGPPAPAGRFGPTGPPQGPPMQGN